MKLARLPLFLICTFVFGLTTVAPHVAAATASPDKAPALVLIIRHAEKPIADDKSSDLAPEGFRRAAALPSLFVPASGSQAPRFPRPDALFATAISKHSNRPVETITPLSLALHLKINHDFEDAETGAVAKEILSGRYASKIVLICWHHGEIPHLAKAFGIASTPKWKEEVYDRVWQISWKDGQASMTVAPQQLMPGDLAE